MERTFKLRNNLDANIVQDHSNIRFEMLQFFDPFISKPLEMIYEFLLRKYLVF